MTFEEFKNILNFSNLIVGWDAFTEYMQGTTVKYNDSLYQALQDNTNTAPDAAEAATVWKLINENFEVL